MGGEAKGVLRIMGGEQHRVALLRQAAHLLQEPKLVAVIQIGGRLVHQQDPRLLGQGPCNEGQLPLAAGDAADAPVCQRGDAHQLHHALRRLQLLPSRLPQGLQPTGSTHKHRVPDGVVEHRLAGLGDIRRQMGQLPPGQMPHVPPAQGDAPLIVGQKAQHTAEQGTLPRPVGPQHCHQLSGLGPEADIPQHRVSAVGKGESLHVNAHAVALP